MIFDSYDRIRVINLPHRTDRRREMEAEFEKVGIAGDPRIGFFPAVQPREKGVFHLPGAHGCFLSHLGVLEEALAAGQSVIVLEDDCQFLASATIAEADEDTHVFYGGYAQASDPDDLQNADIQGSHFMAFSKEAVEKAVPFLRSLLDLSTPIDPSIVRSDFDPQIRPPIDGAYVWFRRYHPEMKTQFETISMQRISATDIGKRKWFDRIPGVRRLANRARRVKEKLAL